MRFTNPFARPGHDKPAAAHDHEKPGPSETDVKRAYERGRRDEGARHKGHPILALGLFAAAAIGVGAVYLAAQQGSFSRAGQLVDNHLAVAADKASDTSQVAANAVSTAGQDVQAAGQTLKQTPLRR